MGQRTLSIIDAMNQSNPSPNQPTPLTPPKPKAKFNPQMLLPVLAGGALAIVLLCAIAFVLGAVFLYQPNAPEVASESSPTPEVEIVRFTEEESHANSEAPPTATAIPPTPIPPEPTPEPPTPEPESIEPSEVITTETVTDPNGEATTATEDPIAAETVEPEPTEVPEPTPEPPTPEPAAPAQTEYNYPVPTINTAPVTMQSPDYGMQVFLFWQEEVADRDLRLVKEADFNWVKQEFAWRELEGAGKGAFDWARTDRIMDQIDSYGLKVIVRLGVQPGWATPNLPMPEVGPPDNMQDWADYVAAVATRYKGRVDAYQIWNEPNLAREWGERPPSPAEYTEMLRVSYQAIKNVDPYPIIISAGMAPTTRNDNVAKPDVYYIQEMYDAGAAAYFDALGAHGPGYKAAPETDPAEIANTPGLALPGDFENNVPEELRRVYGFRHVEDIRAIMERNGDSAKKIVLLEFGWTIDPRPSSPYYWHAVTQEEQAQYFERAYAYAKANWQPWIGVMSLIYVANPQWTQNDEQTYWSIVYPSYPALNVAPAYHGLKKMPK